MYTGWPVVGSPVAVTDVVALLSGPELKKSAPPNVLPAYRRNPVPLPLVQVTPCALPASVAPGSGEVKVERPDAGAAAVYVLSLNNQLVLTSSKLHRRAYTDRPFWGRLVAVA